MIQQSALVFSFQTNKSIKRQRAAGQIAVGVSAGPAPPRAQVSGPVGPRRLQTLPGRDCLVLVIITCIFFAKKQAFLCGNVKLDR